MNATFLSRMFQLALPALFLMAATSAQAASRPSEAPDAIIDVPAGLACAGFDLRIEIWAAAHRPDDKTFKDRNGNVVRLLSAGKGTVLAFTNLSNLASYVVAGTGSVQHTTVNPDGTATVSNTGSNVIVFFPSDVPAGPSTVQYIGNMVYGVDGLGSFTLLSAQGRKIDICAAIG